MDPKQETKKELTKEQLMDVCIELNRKNASLMRDNLSFHGKLKDMKKVLDRTKVMYLFQKEQNDGLRAENKLVEKIKDDIKKIKRKVIGTVDKHDSITKKQRKH
jgi:vacuolar-type H+-ATPase catalytic subunit A/Vma1